MPNENSGADISQENQPQGNEGNEASKEQGQVDLKSLQGDQLKEVLENKELWKQPRMQRLVEAERKLKEFESQQSEAENKRLEEEKKFQELAQKNKAEADTLKQQLTNMRIDQALTNKLAKEGTIDIDGALKLIDRSSIEVDKDGTVKGIDEAFESLKKEKTYLFSNQPGQPLGTPSNQNSGNESGVRKWKQSEIANMSQDEFLKHQTEIVAAMKRGEVEKDLGQ